jgi:hypothetical protein
MENKSAVFSQNSLNLDIEKTSNKRLSQIDNYITRYVSELAGSISIIQVYQIGIKDAKKALYNSNYGSRSIITSRNEQSVPEFLSEA